MKMSPVATVIVIILLLLALIVTLWPIPSRAQSTSFSTGISGIGQALGIGSQLLSLGTQGRMWQQQQQQPNGYYQPGQACFVHNGTQYIPGTFYPVQEADGTSHQVCVATRRQP